MALSDSEIKKLAKKKEHERSEQDWNAIWDAKALANAEIIKADEQRLEMAQAWATVLAMEEQEEAKAMQKVGNA